MHCECPKEWRSLIDSTSFASLHFALYNSNPQNARLFLIEGHRYRRRRCLIRRTDTFRKTCAVDLPTNYGHLWPFGYVNGWVCCTMYDNHDGRVLGFVMWNPSTRKSIEIPPPSGSHHVDGIRVVVVAPASGGANDYKLVVIPFDHPSWNQCPIPPKVQNVPSSVLVEVYSLSTGCWRSAGVDTQCVKSLIVTKNTTTAVLNEAVHWIWKADQPTVDPLIIAFNVQNDVLRHFCLPDGQRFQYSAILSVLNESLVLSKSEQGLCLIWVMKEYGVAESWVNCFKIDMNYGRFLYLQGNGRLFFTMEKQGVKVYDVESQEIEELARSYNGHIFFVDTFVETLALLP